MKFEKKNSPFYSGLKVEIDNYFTTKQISKYGNYSLIIKGIVLVAGYLFAYGSIYLPDRTTLSLLAAYILMGICGVMIVFNIVHDASHSSISPRKWINKTLCYLGDIVGINTHIWDIRHNIQHHSFTNVLDGDLIIEQIPLLRLSHHQPYRKFHKYQPYYAIILYLFYSFYWMFVIDLRLFFRKDICNLHNIDHPRKEWIKLFVFKSQYILYMIVFPWLFTPLSFMSVLGYFFILHFSAGILLSFVAVLGHFVEGPSFPEPVNGIIQNSWGEHELETTIDFAPRSRITNWITGGLNTHVAHHLFPTVCHVHYYDMTKIISEYCRQNNYSYKKETFIAGLRSHFRYLGKLSNPAK